MPRLSLVFLVVALTSVGCSWGVDAETIPCWSDEYCPDGFVCSGGGGAVATSRGRCVSQDDATGPDDDDATGPDDDDDSTPDDDDAADDDDATGPDDDDTPPPVEGSASGECEDLIDNDDDLLWDCNDPDCATAANCPAEQYLPCAPAFVLECSGTEQSYYYANGGPAGQDALDTYCTPSVSGYTGHEVDYAVIPQVVGEYTVTLTGLQADLDLIVLSNSDETCVQTDCLGASQNSGTADESVTFEGAWNVPVHVLVEGWDEALSYYTISLTCP